MIDSLPRSWPETDTTDSLGSIELPASSIPGKSKFISGDSLERARADLREHGGRFMSWAIASTVLATNGKTVTPVDRLVIQCPLPPHSDLTYDSTPLLKSMLPLPQFVRSCLGSKLSGYLETLMAFSTSPQFARGITIRGCVMAAEQVPYYPRKSSSAACPSHNLTHQNADLGLTIHIHVVELQASVQYGHAILSDAPNKRPAKFMVEDSFLYCLAQNHRHRTW